MAGGAAVRRLEGRGQHRQGGRWPLLPAAVPARAVAHDPRELRAMTTTTPAPITAAEDLAAAVVPQLVTELPGPKAQAAIERDQRVVSPSLGRVYPLVPARASGMVVEDVDGNRFLDFNAGIAVNSTGHCHPRVVAAIEIGRASCRE